MKRRTHTAGLGKRISAAPRHDLDDRDQTSKLIDWATSVDGDGRLWAVEAATGLGHLLSQLLVASGQTVVDVPPVVASRIRVLSSDKSQRNGPNDARSVAIAALRRESLAEVRREDAVY
jgi:hypothetical protein